jgi:membrane associated rhomboid family serine protease
MIIPIGTKSSLALKPKLTIGLIAANVVVAAITLPLMIRTESSLLKVRGERLAVEIRLFLAERSNANAPFGVSPGVVEEALGDLEAARNMQSLQLALYNALLTANIQPGEFEKYERTLRQRDTSEGGADTGASDLLAARKALRTREQEISDGSVFGRFGLLPGRMNRIHTFFTHLFLHGGIWHLLGNMLFLWVVGCLLEDSWGRIPFLAFYLAGGALAGLVHCFQDTSSLTPLVGASGAIAAVMGAFTIRHFWTKIKFFYFFLFFFKPYVGTFHLPAFVFLPFWFMTQLALHYLNGIMGGGSNVAYAAHIGGFSAGLLAALAMRFTGFEERFLAPSVRKTQVKAGVLRDPRFERACELLKRGNRDSARALFNKLLDDRLEDVELIQDIALLYRENGLADDYGALTEKALKLMILKGNMEEGTRLALETLNRRDGARINAQYLMRIAKWLTEQQSYGEAHDIYRSIIAVGQPPNVASKASIALAKLLSDKMNNTRDALSVLKEARREPLEAETEEIIAQLEAVLGSRENSLYATDAPC